MIYLHNDRDHIYGNVNHPVFRCTQQIDALVTASARNALFLSNLNRQRPKQALWYDDAINYLRHPNNALPPFLYAHYGSAVEDLVNIQIDGLLLPANVRIILQQQNNGTRPDIVIYYMNESYAWLDITSVHDAKHVYRKANWFERPRSFVAELLYKDLTLCEIRTDHETRIAQLAHFNHAVRIHSLNERVLTRHMMRCTNHALARLSGKLRKDTRKSEISDAFSSAFGLRPSYPCIHLCIKSILQRYRNSCEIMHQNTASEIFNRFYTANHTSQSWEKALEMIEESYKNMQDPYC